MRLEEGSTRLSMCASALLSSVMYHVTIMGNTPQTAQRSTKADHFMMLCYCVNVLVWAAVISQYVIWAANKRFEISKLKCKF